MRQLITRLRHALGRRDFDDELAEEMAFHRAMKQRELEGRGQTSEEAAAGARRALGGEALARDQARDVWSWRWLQETAGDLRYGARALARNPGFTVVAVLTLALGIGANTAVFTVIDGLMLRPPPFEHAERLRWIWDVNRRQGFAVNDATPPSPANFLDWRAGNHSFDYMVGWRNWFFSIAGPSGYGIIAEQVRGVSVSPRFFDMLGVRAALGRTFQPDEEAPERASVAVLGDGLWKRRFAADPKIVGAVTLVDGRPFTIVGVLPSDFRFLTSDFDLWIPLAIDANARRLRASHSIAVIARLSSHATQADAQLDLDRMTRNLQHAYPATNADWDAGLQRAFPLNQNLRPMLLLLAAAVGCVLLIASINLANLLLVRAGVRQRELATRAAIGASRMRLVRQLLTESALLTVLGAAAGILIAVWTLDFVRPFLTQVQVARPLTLAVDRRVLLFTLGLACVTLTAVGAWPAWRGSGMASLRVVVPSQRTLPGRAWSIVQIAASLMLLVAAVLLVKSLRNLQRVDPGFQPERLLTMQVWLPETQYATGSRVSGFARDVLRRVEQHPQVQTAAIVNTRPFQGWAMGATVKIAGQTPHSLNGDPIVGCRVISPGYFRTLGTPVIRGRDFADGDGVATLAVALINQTMARRFWPAGDPIGKSLRIRSLGDAATAPWWPSQETDTFTVVGIVGDIKENQLKDQFEPIVYLSYLQNPSRYLHLIVKTDAAAADVLGLVQRDIRTIDPGLGVYDIQTMDDALAQAVAEPKLDSLFLWAFAGIALLLSAIGVYGVTSYAVEQRGKEFAIRLAIGASRRSIFQIVTRDGLIDASAGIVCGLGGAVVLGRMLGNLLYGIPPTDGSALLASTTVVLVVALLACWRPAWRATRIDPIGALRRE